MDMATMTEKKIESERSLQSHNRRVNLRMKEKQMKNAPKFGDGPCGDTLLLRDVRAGDIKAAIILIEEGLIDINATDFNRHTALCEAIYNPNPQLVILVIKFGASVDIITKTRLTLLHIVIEELYVTIEDMDKQEKKNKEMTFKWISKHQKEWVNKEQTRIFSCMEGKRNLLLRIFIVLYDAGAPVNVKNSNGKTVADELRSNRADKCKQHRDMLEYFLTPNPERIKAEKAIAAKKAEEWDAAEKEVLDKVMEPFLKKMERKAKRQRKVKARLVQEEEEVPIEEIVVAVQVEEDPQEQLGVMVAAHEEEVFVAGEDLYVGAEENVIEDVEVLMDVMESEHFEDVGGENHMDSNVVAEGALEKSANETVPDDDSAMDCVDNVERDTEQQKVSAEIVQEEPEYITLSDESDEFPTDIVAEIEAESSSEGPDVLQAIEEDVLDASLDIGFPIKHNFKEEVEQQDLPKEHLGAVELAVNENDVALSVTPGVQEPIQEVFEVRVVPLKENALKKEEPANGAGGDIEKQASVEPREPVGQEIGDKTLLQKQEDHKNWRMKPLNVGVQQIVEEIFIESAREKLVESIDHEMKIDCVLHSAPTMNMVKPTMLSEVSVVVSQADSEIEPSQPFSMEDYSIMALAVLPAERRQTDPYTLTIRNPQAESRTPGESAERRKRKLDSKAFAVPKIRKTSTHYDNPSARAEMIRESQNFQSSEVLNTSTNLIIERTFQLGGGQTRTDKRSVAAMAKKYSGRFGDAKPPPQPTDSPVVTVPPEPVYVPSRAVTSLVREILEAEPPTVIVPVPNALRALEDRDWHPPNESSIWKRPIPRKFLCSNYNKIHQLFHKVAIETKVPTYEKLDKDALSKIEKAWGIVQKLLGYPSKY